MPTLSQNLYKLMRSVMSKTGVDATLIVDSEGVYDPVTSQDISTTTTYPVRICIMDFALISNGTLTESGTLNTTSDKQVYLDDTQADGSPLPFRIKANGMKLKVGAITYRITVVKEYNPSDSIRIVYDLKVEL